MKGVFINGEESLSVQPLTEEEIKWVNRLQRTLVACPSSRLSLLNIGDPSFQIVDEDGAEGSDLCDGKADQLGLVLADILGGPRVIGVS